MVHTVMIWSKRKKDGKGFLIETRIKIDQSQIENMALAEYKNYMSSTNDDREYWAEIEQTIH